MITIRVIEVGSVTVLVVTTIEHNLFGKDVTVGLEVVHIGATAHEIQRTK